MLYPGFVLSSTRVFAAWGVFYDALFVRYLFPQHIDFVLNAFSLIRVGSKLQILLSVLRRTLRVWSSPSGEANHCRWRGSLAILTIKVAGEVDVLTAFQAERHFGAAIEKERTNRFLVLECTSPFLLADGLTPEAIGR